MLISILLAIMIRQTHILMKVKIFLLTLEEQWEDLLGNQNMNKEHRSEDDKEDDKVSDDF